MTEPVFRWPGGKRRLVSRIVPLVQAALDARPGAVYVEPFLGAGAVALALDRPRMVLNDASPDLMNAWTWIQQDPDRLHRRVTERLTRRTREDYAAARDELSRVPLHTVERAALFFYLSALAFNGLWRVNGAGEFNVPYGDGRGHVASLDALRGASHAIRQASLRCALANEVIRRELSRVAKPVLYCDPPYDEGFDGYTSSGFGPDDQVQLAEMLHHAADEGAAVIASNANTERIRQLYAWAHVEPVSESRTIAADASRRASADCVLITANIPGGNDGR